MRTMSSYHGRSRVVIYENFDLAVKYYLRDYAVDRAAREYSAMQMVAARGVGCPIALRLTVGRPTPHVTFRPVSGASLRDLPFVDVVRLLPDIQAVLGRVRAIRQAEGAAHGWDTTRTEPPSEFLSAPLARLPDFDWLAAAVAEVPTGDWGRCASLHRDLKLDHLLVTGSGVAVLDWEACALGPECIDVASLAWNLLRRASIDGRCGASETEATIAHLVSARDLDTPLYPSLLALAWTLAMWSRRRGPQHTIWATATARAIFEADSWPSALTTLTTGLLSVRDQRSSDHAWY